MILYGLLLGVVIGALVGGRLMRLADLQLSWGWVGLAAIGFQLLLFSSPLGSAMGWLAPFAYVASTAVVLLPVLANIRRPGMPLVATGALSNLAAVVANGGYMPATRAALELADRGHEVGYSNSALVAHPALGPLTDVFAVPAGVPLANVFSVGDVLVAVGLAVVVAASMRSSSHLPPAPG